MRHVMCAAHTLIWLHCGLLAVCYETQDTMRSAMRQKKFEVHKVVSFVGTHPAIAIAAYQPHARCLRRKATTNRRSVLGEPHTGFNRC